MDTEITAQLSTRYKQLRALEHLAGAATLAAHILTRISGGGSGGGQRVDGGDKATIPINSSALDDANSIYVMLLKWAMGHSRALHVAPPAIALGWSRLEEPPNGFPSWATPVDAAVLVASVVDWLTAWDDAISELTVAPVYWDAIAEELEPLHKRWMPDVKVQVFASRDCPSCDRHTIIVDYDEVADDVTVGCSYCGFVIPGQFRQKYLDLKASTPA